MKVLQGDRPDAPDQAARSLREIQVQAGLDHPHIAAVHNAFWTDDALILVMELIEGRSLRSELELGRLSFETAIDYACQALSALEHAHQHGVIHRDVSPSNMMVNLEGVLKLTDFGLSKNTSDLKHSRPGAPVGSVHYMSPEQVRGALVGPASDIYSLGTVLYEMVTGTKPFDGPSEFVIMVAQVDQAPAEPLTIEPGLPPELNQAILRALSKDPASRFSSAEEFRQALLGIKLTGAPALSAARPLNRALQVPAQFRFRSQLRFPSRLRFPSQVRLPRQIRALGEFRLSQLRFPNQLHFSGRLRLPNEFRLPSWFRFPTQLPFSFPHPIPRSWKTGAAGVALAIATLGVAAFPPSHWWGQSTHSAVPQHPAPAMVRPPSPSVPPTALTGAKPVLPASKSDPAIKSTVQAVSAPAAQPSESSRPKKVRVRATSKSVTEQPTKSVFTPPDPVLPASAAIAAGAIETRIEEPPAIQTNFDRQPSLNLPVQPIRPLAPAPAKSDPEAKPGAVRKGLGKIWRALRGKDDTAENPATTPPESR
jgi:serine/threonine protein kinase